MKQLVVNAPFSSTCCEVPRPVCPEDGLLLKVDYVGLCGSDVRAYTQGSGNLNYPVVLGHEFVGTIEEVGTLVEAEWHIGEVITANPTVSCNRCHECFQGRYDLCSDLEIAGNTFPGAFAQYMVLPGFLLQRGQIIKLPDNAKKEDFVLTELLASVLTAQTDLNVSLGETVVIVGSGPIGCLHAQVARLRGATKVILADLNANRLKKCADLGPTHLIHTKECDLVDAVMELTDGYGADVFINACPAWEPCQQGLELLRKEGRLSVFGGLPSDKRMAVLDINLIHYKRLRVFGAFTYPLKQFQLSFELIRDGRINTGIITHIIPLSDMKHGVDLVSSGEAIKVLMKP